jgi:hypothetical protein
VIIFVIHIKIGSGNDKKMLVKLYKGLMFIGLPTLESVGFLLSVVTLIGAKASVTNVYFFMF